MYHTDKMPLDEELKMSHSQVRNPQRRSEPLGVRNPEGPSAPGRLRNPSEPSERLSLEGSGLKGAPAREHGAGSRAGSPDASAVSPSLRGGPTWRFESSIPG